MSDGTTGSFRETTFGGGTKIPIALVLDKDNHMAIALKEASGGAEMEWCTNTNGYHSKQTNTHMVADLADALNSQATSGYDETWDGSYSTSVVTGEKVKGKNADFTAFKAAADYNPGVSYTGSPTLQWYLPSYSDFKWLFSVLGFGDKTTVTQTGNFYAWYGNLSTAAFTQVGGTTIDNKWYWSSSEFGGYSVGLVWLQASSVVWGGLNKYPEYRVRPFVKY